MGQARARGNKKDRVASAEEYRDAKRAIEHAMDNRRYDVEVTVYEPGPDKSISPKEFKFEDVKMPSISDRGLMLFEGKDGVTDFIPAGSIHHMRTKERKVVSLG